jgi:hypothetical protein
VNGLLNDAQISSKVELTGHGHEAFTLWQALEVSLKITAEYYIKRDRGDAWKREVAGEGFKTVSQALFEQSDDTEPPAIEQVSYGERLKPLLEEEYDGEEEEYNGKNVRELRNEMVVHLEKPPLAGRPLEWFLEQLLELLGRFAEVIPAVCTVETAGPGADTYRIRLHWNRTQKKAVLVTSAALEPGHRYYLPSTEATEEIIEVPADTVIECENEFLLGELDSEEKIDPDRSGQSTDSRRYPG